jgi:microcystin-dependent protein
VADTTTDGWPFVEGTDKGYTIDEWSEALADKLQAMYVADVRASRPSSGWMKGRRFVSTDTVAEFVDTGATWIRLGVPAGTIICSAKSTAPSGWVAVHGQTVSRTGIYLDLFAEWSTFGGVGDGSTTFTLPDVRGRALIGAGTGTGLTARTAGTWYGAETHTLLTTETPAGIVYDSGTGFGDLFTQPAFGSGFGLISGAGQPHNNMQPSIPFYYYAKL